MQRRLIRHGTYCLTIIIDGIWVAEGEEWTLQKLGDPFSDQGRLDEAEATYDCALQGHQKALSHKHVNTNVLTLDNVEDFAKFYIQQCRILQARILYMRYQPSFKAVFGVEHAQYKRVI